MMRDDNATLVVAANEANVSISVMLERKMKISGDINYHPNTTYHPGLTTIWGVDNSVIFYKYCHPVSQ